MKKSLISHILIFKVRMNFTENCSFSVEVQTSFKPSGIMQPAIANLMNIPRDIAGIIDIKCGQIPANQVKPFYIGLLKNNKRQLRFISILLRSTISQNCPVPNPL
jgi:hypothetical protein